jgi:hypothetical protein
MDWDALSGLIPVVLWLLFLVAKKRKQARTRPGRRRAREETNPRRDYDPIEPS